MGPRIDGAAKGQKIVREERTMSDKQRTDTGRIDDDDAGRPTGDAGDDPAGRAVAPRDDTGAYPAEKLDLGGGTSDGDTPSTDDGG